MDDKGIIDLYFARDEKAIDETMKSYNGRLLRFASRFLSDPRDAEECVNDAYVRAWDTIPPNRPNNLFAYLAALCRNAALDVVKKNSAQKRSAQLEVKEVFLDFKEWIRLSFLSHQLMI